METARHSELQQFVSAHLPARDFDLAPASADASFRSYWRVRANEKTWVVMDAPPGKENIAPWLDIGARLRAAGLHTPEVFAVDHARGFILMEDLGDLTYLPELARRKTDSSFVDALYDDAIEALSLMQTIVSPLGLPRFDEAFVNMELEIMPAWFLESHLGFTPGVAELDTIAAAFRLLTENVRAQPQVFMHRDYHSRNLLIAKSPESGAVSAGKGNPAIIDFQGAVHGPIAYDLVSLLRDCYISWPADQIDAWIDRYYVLAKGSRLIDAPGKTFRRWFDLAGLQRHIKVLGLFCRLNYRDGKAAYLADLPLVFDYVLGVARLYPELEAFAALVERAVGSRDITRASTREQAA